MIGISFVHQMPMRGEHFLWSCLSIISIGMVIFAYLQSILPKSFVFSSAATLPYYQNHLPVCHGRRSMVGRRSMDNHDFGLDPFMGPTVRLDFRTKWSPIGRTAKATSGAVRMTFSYPYARTYDRRMG